MADYVEISTINASAFASATASWCEAYCAGGSFYSGNSSANPMYAPQVLEILNEPYATYWGYPVSATDVQAYATLLQDIRTDLDNVGLKNISILAAADNNANGWGSEYSNWDSQLLSDGGFAATQGVTIHPYGDNGNISVPTGTVSSSQVGWANVYYINQFLNNAGLTTQASNVYITEDGWCSAGGGGDCVAPDVTEAQKDANIGVAINQLATTSWIKGFWLYRLHDVGGDTYGLYDTDTGITAGDQSPAWGAFQSAAQTSGF
jgi:hypothetical protein